MLWEEFFRVDPHFVGGFVTWLRLDFLFIYEFTHEVRELIVVRMLSMAAEPIIN